MNATLMHWRQAWAFRRGVYGPVVVGLCGGCGVLALFSGCGLLGNIGDRAECGNGLCEPGESFATCDLDCDEPPAGRPCLPGGDECEADEQCVNNVCRPADGAIFCGDGLCELGETLLSCPQDCLDGGGPGTIVCGDGECEMGETALSCPIDCIGGGPGTPSCGNGECESGETILSCPADCLNGGDEPSCGPTCLSNAQCEDGDLCTTDTCGPAPAECGSVSICRSTPRQCAFGQTCVGGICRVDRLCFSDTDCSIGQDCVDGRCMQRP